MSRLSRDEIAARTFFFAFRMNSSRDGCGMFSTPIEMSPAYLPS
jgi:hypothetical protein